MIAGLFVIGIFCFEFLLIQTAKAELATGASMSSTNFKILDSQQGSFGSTSSSSSSSFLLLGNLGDIGIGSSSITDFKLKSGFLYYPKVTAPTLDTATAGDGQVTLSWTAATAFQGLSVGSYDVCFKSSGSYSCSNVGNITSYTKTGLTNGTTYTFEIEAEDALGNIIAISNEKSAAPVSSSSGGGGGGGGGYISSSGSVGTVVVNGTAYPKSTVVIYNDGVMVATITAGTNAIFQAIISNITTGSHTVSLNSQDSNGRKSLTISFVVSVTAGNTVTLSDILLPPTIDISATRLNPGDIIRIFGQAQPSSAVDVHVFSTEIVNTVAADNSGAYELAFNTKPLAESTHITKSQSVIGNLFSPFSQVLQFILGAGGGSRSADFNNDGKVNITDFSILLYWWGSTNPTGLSKADINHDGKINIIDFSIMLFQWTG